MKRHLRIGHLLAGSCSICSRRARCAAVVAAAWLMAASASAGPPPPYDLFFVPPTPLPPNVSEADGVVMFGVALQNGCAGPFTPITWNVSLVPVTADATDFGPPTPTDLIYSEGMLTQMFSVTIVNDGAVEGPETFDILLTPGGNVNLDCVIPEQMPSQPMYGLTVTINDDAPPVGDLAVGDSFAPENQASMAFDLFLTPANPGPMSVTVDWSTSDGTAISGEDYVASGGQVTFLPGDGAQQVQVGLIDDALVEGDHTFFVNLSNPSAGGQITDGQGLGTIQDDDMLMPVDVFVDDTTVQENTPGFATFDVRLSQPNPDIDPVSVTWSTSNGSAVAGQDYVANGGIVNFPPGTSMVSVQVQITDDGQVEGDETFFVDLTNTSTNAQVADGQAQGTIQDDDVASMIDVFVDDSFAPETAGMIAFDVRITPANPGPGPITVDFSTADGAATAGADYVAESGQVTFLPGDSNQVIQITLIDDMDVEGPHEFFVNLSNPSANVGIVDGQAVGTIQDDDDETDEPLLSIADATLAEGDEGTTGVELTVTLSEPIEVGVQVSFATADGTATSEDNDYQTTSGLLSFAPGTTTQTLVVPVRGDLRLEDDETFLVQLADPVGAMLADGQAVVTITNDDQEPPGLSINDVSLLEGDAGTTNAVFTVSLTRPRGQNGTDVAGTVIVSFATADGTATIEDSDYQAVSGQLLFEDGESTQTVTVAVVGDAAIEADETFFVELSAADGAMILVGRGRGTIRNDDQGGNQPLLSISDIAVDEGNVGVTQAAFQVSLSMPSEQTVTVDFATADGSATAGEDYASRSGSLTLTPGQTSASFSVAIAGDTTVEPDEQFFANLANPVGAVIGDGQGRGVIRNDDSETVSQVRFVGDRQSVMEAGGAAEIAVERIGSAAGAAQVVVTTVPASAQSGQDFRPLQETVRWQPGELGRKLVRVAILDDSQREGDEVFGLRLSQPAGAELGEPRAQQVTIIDDDTPLRLEAVGDQEVTAKVRQEFDLQVRATRMDGSPVSGAPVVWRAEGRAEVVGPEERPSDDEGVSTVRIRPSNMPGPATVVALLQGTESAVAFAIRIEGDLGSLGGNDDQGDNQGEDDIAGVLDQGCSTATGDLLEACDFLFGIDDDDERRRALDELTPRDIVTQGNAALRAPRVQLRNVSSRLNTLRGGSARLAAADQLSISIQGDTLAVGTVRTAMTGYGKETEKIARAVNGALDNAFDALSGRPTAVTAWADDAMAGTESSGAVGLRMPRGGGASADDSTESPWGFFVNGRVSFGDAPQTNRESAYDFETQGLTAGVDYRLNDRFVLGASVGYLGTDIDLVGDGGDLEVTGYSLSLYTTYYTRRFYVDGIIAYGQNEYALERVINLPRQFRGQTRLIARGEPDGDQLSVDLGVGYDFQLGAVTLGGFLRGSLVDATVDPFVETGAGPFDLRFSSQEVESLQSEAGLELSYPASFRWGVVQPSLRLSYLHEFEDDRRVVRARFRSDSVGRPFAVVTDTPDRDFFNVGAGVTVTLPRSMATYLIIDSDLERDDLDIYTLSGGFRFQF